jgi:adenylate cyclase
VIGSSAEVFLRLASSGRQFSLANGQTWAIGRGDGCAVMLDSRSVSRLHALIQRKDGGDYALVDLGSRNGSFVNSRRVTTPVVLSDKDRLLFGDQELVFRSAASSEAGTSAMDTDTRNAPTTALHTHTLSTILVVDIRDYTPLARSVSEVLLSQTIGTWFLRVGQIAQARGSWAQKYIGDAVMAVWVHDESNRTRFDIWQALRAASEIATATDEVSRSLPLPAPLRIGAGINTGPAIIGSTDYTALGDTVNAAFRLEAATKVVGLGVAIGERSYDELKVPPLSPFLRHEVNLKGYESPATAWAISFEGLRTFLEKRPA